MHCKHTYTNTHTHTLLVHVHAQGMGDRDGEMERGGEKELTYTGDCMEVQLTHNHIQHHAGSMPWSYIHTYIPTALS